MNRLAQLPQIVDALAADYIRLSDRIWEIPELAFAEHLSSAEHARQLELSGFRVTTSAGGLPTAVLGEAGSGGPVIAILGEYDALPRFSQQAGSLEQMPLEPGGPGHACGHNLLGAGSMLAAAAVKAFLEENGLPGRVRYYGCPAEETGSGKGHLVRAGLFDDVDIAISWHPSQFFGVNPANSLARNEIDFHFTGRAAHAAVAPHMGRSALDAVELMNVGVNFLREHMLPSARVHYAITDAGGDAANVVQANASVHYSVRTRDLADLGELVERVLDIARGAALMTGTTMRHVVTCGEANLVGNTPLEAAMQDTLERLGPAPFDEADRKTAAGFQSTLSEADIAMSFRRFGAPRRPGMSLCDLVLPPQSSDSSFAGSTDVGTVSWVVPTVQLRGATMAIGTPIHSWQMVAQGKLPAAHKGFVHAAKAMAMVACQALTQPELVAAARSDLRERVGMTEFKNPLP